MKILLYPPLKLGLKLERSNFAAVFKTLNYVQQ